MTQTPVAELWEWAELEECRLGRKRYAVRSTPTVMLPNGTKARPPIAVPRMRGRQIVGVQPLPCCGEACLDATRALFDRALQSAPAQATPEGDRP